MASRGIRASHGIGTPCIPVHGGTGTRPRAPVWAAIHGNANWVASLHLHIGRSPFHCIRLWQIGMHAVGKKYCCSMVFAIGMSTALVVMVAFTGSGSGISDTRPTAQQSQRNGASLVGQ